MTDNVRADSTSDAASENRTEPAAAAASENRTEPAANPSPTALSEPRTATPDDAMSGPWVPAPKVEVEEPPDAADRAAAWFMQRGALPALALITICMVSIYAHMFAGELAGDDLTFHMAESARLADCLRNLDFDFWNDSANGGFASAYYYQVIPQLASAVPAAIFGHHVFFFELSVFLPLVLAPAAAYRGARLLGATPWQAAIAALAVGFLNGESRWGTGNAGTFNVGLYTQTWALAAFPIALGHAVRWATRARGLAPAIAWGAFVTLCHPFAGVSLGFALVAGCLARPVLALSDHVFAAIGNAIDGDPEDGLWAAAKARLGARWRGLEMRWLGPWLGELGRLALLALCLVIAWLPVLVPLIVDYAGFGGFPHRVDDEIGPGFRTLGAWFVRGHLFDFGRPLVLTWVLPIVVVLARPRSLRWLWAPALLFAVWLGLGPHLGKTDDDLIPAVRFLGAMQVVSGLAIGIGALWLGQRIWHAPEGAALHRPIRALVVSFAGRGRRDWAREVPLQYAVRTGLVALGAALTVLVALPGAHALASRVHVLDDFPGSQPAELRTIAYLLQSQPAGRKQVGKGAENHWWNLLSYEYGRRPSTLMMGGGGLQASPNYDFLWSSASDHAKIAWVYDAPYLVFRTVNADKMPLGDELLATKHFSVRRLPSEGLAAPVQVVGTLPPGRKPAHAAALDWMRAREPLENRVLAYAGSGGEGPEPDAKIVRAFRQDSPGDDADIYVEVDAKAASTIVVRESWHPRWHAYLDRVEVPVRRVTPDFPAIDVPIGHHVIALRFERPWWAQAVWLAWPLMSMLGWIATRRRRA